MRRPLSIFDLMLFTLVSGVHLAHLPLAVAHADSPLTILINLVPTLIAVWIQLRFRLKTLQATLTHYIVCVAWAFLYGYGYCLALNASQATAPTHGRMLEPISWAYDGGRQMAVFALLTSAIYAAVSWWALRARIVAIGPMSDIHNAANHAMMGSGGGRPSGSG